MPGFFDEMDNIERVDSRLAKIEQDIKRIWQALNDVKGDVDSRLKRIESLLASPAGQMGSEGKLLARVDAIEARLDRETDAIQDRVLGLSRRVSGVEGAAMRLDRLESVVGKLKTDIFGTFCGPMGLADKVSGVSSRESMLEDEQSKLAVRVSALENSVADTPVNVCDRKVCTGQNGRPYTIQSLERRLSTLERVMELHQHPLVAVNPETFDFAAAVKHMKAGKSVTRRGYMPKNYWDHFSIGEIDATDWTLAEDAEKEKD